MRTEIDLNESEIECEHFLKANRDLSEIDPLVGSRMLGAANHSSHSLVSYISWSEIDLKPLKAIWMWMLEY